MSTEEEKTPEQEAESPQGFEQRLAHLERYLEELERGELPLEEAIAKYEAAVAELRRCYKLVSAAEEKVEQLLQGADGEPKVAPLKVDEGQEETPGEQQGRGGRR